jgi:1-acyl-sn-glycerol-3-phosphate acyltransferase
MNAVVPQNSTVPADEEALARRLLEIVRALAVELHPGMPGVNRLTGDASIERDFGLDSLARVELGERIERALATPIADTLVAESETVHDLASALLRKHAPEASAAAARQPRIAVVESAVSPAPVAPATLLDALEWHATEHPERTYVLLVDDETGADRVSFGALRSQAAAVAASLVKHGVRPGEAVAIMLPTGREFFAAFYGALYAGAVPVPLYPPARPAQIEAHLRRVAGILANCDARILLTFDRAKRLAHLLRALAPKLERTATLDELSVAENVGPPVPARPGDTAFLQYTSGSTGQPKGVVLTHANILANLDAMRRVTDASSADTFVSWLPLYHDMGLIGACFGALIVGFPLVLMSPIAFLSHPERWLRAIDRHRATITAAPNFAYELCLKKVDDGKLQGLDLSSLRLAFNGAEPVSAATVERFAARLAPYGMRREALMPVYGLAECAVGLTFPPAGRGPLIDRVARDAFLRSGQAGIASEGDPTSLQLVSCGPALPGHAVRIVDERGVVLAERTQGRIEFRGPSATSGYFHNPGETARLFDGEWLDTGDLGYLANGELYVTGRAKDIIIRGGHKIHPQELEVAVAQLPAVRKGGVAVFRATDPRSATERIVVLVETTEHDDTVRADLIAAINRLAVDLIGLPVDEVVLAPPRTVLKTSSGKIRRTACRDAYERGELGATARAPWLQITRLAYRAAVARVGRAMRRLMAFARSLRILIAAVCVAIPLWLTVILTPGLGRRRRAAAAIVRLALSLGGVSLRVQGLQAAGVGPKVFVANHASYLDALLVLAALPPDVTFVAKQEFVGSMVLGRVLERVGCAFVSRFDVREATVGAEDLQARLQRGESLVIFAEGTFHRDPGLLPFHMGAFTAAAATGAQVVPIALCGTRTMLPDGAMMPRPTAIEIDIGEPLAPLDASWQAAVELRRRTRQHILRHTHEPDLELLPGATLP